MQMNEAEQCAKGFDYASEKTKQLITLSTGIIAVTISFSKDILGGVVARWPISLLMGAWLLYLVSILFGVQLLGRFAAQLMIEPLRSDALNSSHIALPAKRQVHCFVWGICFTVAFGICTAYTSICGPTTLPAKPGTTHVGLTTWSGGVEKNISDSRSE